MRSVKKLALAVAAAALLSGAVWAKGKKIEYSTDSQEARRLVEEIARGIESFQAGPALLQLGQKLIEADPDWGFAHMYASQFAPAQQANEMLNKADELSDSLNDGEKRYLEGVKHIRAGNVQDAREVFEGLARDYPGERRAHMLVGQLSMGSDADAACRAFQRAYQLDHSTARIYLFRGNCQLVDGKYEKARKIYGKGMKKASDESFPFGLYFGAILTHVHEGNVDKALKTVDKGLEGYLASPNAQNFPPVFIHNLRARINLEHGRYQEALADYKRGLESLEGSGLPEQQIQIWTGRYRHGRGRVLAKMGKHEEAWQEAEYIRKAIDEGGSAGAQFEPAYHYLAGYLKLEAGQPEAAVEHLEQAGANNPFNQALLARAYTELGKNDKAREAYQAVADSTQVSLDRALVQAEAVKMLEKLEAETD